MPRACRSSARPRLSSASTTWPSPSTPRSTTSAARLLADVHALLGPGGARAEHRDGVARADHDRLRGGAAARGRHAASRRSWSAAGFGDGPCLPGRAARRRPARPADRLARPVGPRGRGGRPRCCGRRVAARPSWRSLVTLAGQRVVVVGGTSGMGLATVRAAAAQGAEVVAAGRRPVAGREPIEGVVQAHVDVTDEASVRALFDGSGRVDHLFVSASPGLPGPVARAGARRRRGPSSTASSSAPGRAPATPRRTCRRRVDHVRHRRRGRPPAARRGDGHGRVRRRRGAVARAGARARAAAREHDPPRLHRQRDVGAACPPPSATTCAGASRPRCRSGRMGTPEDIAHAAAVPDDEPPDHGRGARGQRRRDACRHAELR